MSCPLCSCDDAVLFFQDNQREYLRCPQCALVFVPPHHYLTPEQEKAEYDFHQNSPDDAGYRRFLGRMANPLLELLTPQSTGLDFGCGPGPTLSLMFEEHGHSVALYDKFYHADESLFGETYDFITATEVAEHLHEPLAEIKRLWRCLGSGGVLGVMTKMVRDRDAFVGWHYKNDPTHVCFFARETFEWLGMRLGAELSFHGNDVVLLQKRDPSRE